MGVGLLGWVKAVMCGKTSIFCGLAKAGGFRTGIYRGRGTRGGKKRREGS